MKIKNFLPIFIAADLCISMCGCGTASNSKTESSSASAGTKSSIETDNAGSAAAESSIETNNADSAAAESTDNSEAFSMWKEDGVITELIDYVEDVTDEESENFIPVSDRIAVFDLDGTLVGERAPIYYEWMILAQRVFDDETFEATDEMKEVANEILAAAESRSIPSDLEEKEYKVYGEAFAGMTQEEYEAYVENFLSQEVDYFAGMTYSESYFRPMTQILSYLEENDFMIYIVSGTDRMSDRVMARQFTDVANYRIIGTDYYTEGADHTGEDYLEYQVEAGEDLVRTDNEIIKNVKASKAVQMQQEIGQKPVLAFGNSTGDYSMMEYVTDNNEYKSAAFYILPDDDEREYANMEKVEQLTSLCTENGWYAVSMKDDFLTIYGDGVTKNEDNHPLLDSLLEKTSAVTEDSQSKDTDSEDADTDESKDADDTEDDFFSLSADEQIDAYNAMDPETAYKIIEASSCSWCVTAYDLITPENVKDFVIIYLNDDGTTAFNLRWPVYGGYDPETIASIKELSGKVSVSRVGGDGGYCICYGTNDDGSQYTMSQRSVPVSSSEATTGVMDVDLYKQTAEIVTSTDSGVDKVKKLQEIGIDEESAENMLSDYAAWLGRSEIAGANNIQDGISSVGHTVDPDYGYYGKTISWEVSGLTLEGGSGQMNTIYSWGTLKSSGIVTDIETVTID